MSEVKVRERGILFSGDMVRAILDGRKTQTRRVVKLREDEYGVSWVRADGGHQHDWMPTDEDGDDIDRVITCPYGQVGDRLWVRERIINRSAFNIGAHRSNGVEAAYAADGATVRPDDPSRFLLPCPSIHMPRWASRILLEITDVRVERLQEVVYEDARAEGIGECDYSTGSSYCTHCGGHEPVCYRERFRELWDSINAKRGFSWESNPWVWVIEFKHASDAHQALKGGGDGHEAL